MTQHHYFYFFQGHFDIKHAYDFSKDSFYSYLKKLFLDPVDSKWKVKKYKRFVTDNNLNFRDCYEVLSDFGNTEYFNNRKGKKGFKLFKPFVQTLKRYNKINSKRKYQIKNSPIKFYRKLFDMLTVDTDMSTEEILRFIHNNFITEFTYSTFRSYWFDHKFI